MSNHLSSSLIQCPYCGEQLELLLDASTGSHHYVEDCQVCCAPIEVTVRVNVNGEVIEVLSKRDCD